MSAEHLAPVTSVEEWSFYDGKQAGLLQHNGRVLYYQMHSTGWDALYPEDDEGHDLPRVFDVYESPSGPDEGSGPVGWCDESDFVRRPIA